MSQHRLRNAIRIAGIPTLTLILAQGAHALDEVHLQTDWIPSGEHAMYYGGWSKGIFEKHGIDIKITRGYGSGDTITKLAGNAFDFGIADFGAVLAAKAKSGIPVTAIGMLYTHSPHSLFVLESSGIENFSDLEGKRIGITPGNSHKLYFPKVAERAGTDSSKIIWVNTDGATMAPLLIRGRLDAAPFYSIHHYYQNKAAKQEGEEIAVLPFEEVGFAIYAASLVTSDRMIENDPDLVERFLAAVYETFEWAAVNPKEACELHVDRVPEVAMDDCLGSLDATLDFVFNEHSEQFGLGQYSQDRLGFTWEVVKDAQDIDAEFDPENALDTSMVPGN